MRILAIMVGFLLSLSVVGVAEAKPLILAQTVTGMCRVEGTTVYSVAVKLNMVTANSYGTGLYYHFQPVAGGAAIVLPSPTPLSDPVQLAVPSGAYKLIISDTAALTAGASQSPEYAITVPTKLFMTLGQKKICAKLMKVAPVLLPNAVKKAE